MNATWSNIKYPIVLACFKLKKQTNISILEYKCRRLKSKFGVDYLTLVGDSAPVRDLHKCLGFTLEEFHILQDEIKENFEQIREKEERINEKLRDVNFPQPRGEPARNRAEKKPKKKNRGKKRRKPTTAKESTRTFIDQTEPTVNIKSVTFDCDSYQSTSLSSLELTPAPNPKRTKLKKGPSGRGRKRQ